MNNEQMISEIKRIKEKEHVLILAHYYQNSDIQQLADYVGDSYQLSVIAKNTSAKTIIFCGVHFMAESAKLLSPEKEVYLPVKNAGCYMAETITYDKLKSFKDTHPEYKIVGYVNTSAKVKSLCDVCVTSANALKILANYQNDKVMYIPDQNLARYANSLNPHHQIEYWDGCCSIHHHLTSKMVENMKELHPEAEVIIHPEAKLEVLALADFVGSTKGMIEYVKKSSAPAFIVGTEAGILFELRKENPHKQFYLLSPTLKCHSMKMTTIEDVYKTITKDSTGRYLKIVISEEIAQKARAALDKMLELSKKE